jgi:hypothetical protein
LSCLIRCVHKFFDLHLEVFFSVKKHVEKICIFIFFIMFWCLGFNAYSYDVFFFLESFMKVSLFLVSPFNPSLLYIFFVFDFFLLMFSFFSIELSNLKFVVAFWFIFYCNFNIHYFYCIFFILDFFDPLEFFFFNLILLYWVNLRLDELFQLALYRILTVLIRKFDN